MHTHTTLVATVSTAVLLVAAPPHRSLHAHPDEVDSIDRESSSDGTPADETPPVVEATPLAELTAAEIEAQDGAEVVHSPPEPEPRIMRAEGVVDPFPDRVVHARPRDAGLLIGLGLGLAVAGTITARLTLLPNCRDEDDVSTCAAPDRGDIGVRVGRLVGTAAFAIGSAAFGGFGGRELGEVLRRRGAGGRRAAIGIGATSVAVGAIGLVAGSLMFGIAARRSLDAAASFDGGVTELDTETRAQLASTIDQIRLARAGLMVLAGTPVLFAAGIGLLVQPPRTPRVRVAPMVSRDRLGLAATIRF